MGGCGQTIKFAAAMALAAAFCAPGQVQDYVTGDECLFCHRNTIGVGWSTNRHNLTTRGGAEAETFLLGAGKLQRALRRTGYGQFAMEGADFNAECAGCHMTMVNPKTRAASAVGIDCVACHGAVDLNHSTDTNLVWLSKKQKTDIERVNATCAQCHLRGGKFTSTGLPYPAAFLAGSLLFPDYAVTGESLDAADAHVLRTVREAKTTCLECHRVHTESGRRHRLAAPGEHCNDCHYAEGPRKNLKPRAGGSKTCRY
jgi:hypothetical protein